MSFSNGLVHELFVEYCLFFFYKHTTAYEIGILFFSSRRRHTRSLCDWIQDVCSSDLLAWPPIFRILSCALSHYSRSFRQEERRVGKECRDRGWQNDEKRGVDHGRRRTIKKKRQQSLATKLYGCISQYADSSIIS